MSATGTRLMALPWSAGRAWVAALDAALMVFAMLAVAVLRFDGALEDLREYFLLGLAGAALGVSGFWLLGLYREILPYASLGIWMRMALGMGAATVLLIGGCLLVGPRDVARPVLLGFGLLSLVSCGGMRLLGAKRLARGRTGPAGEPIPVVIYGAGASGVGLAAALGQSPFYRPVAFVDDDLRLVGSRIRGLQVHGAGDLPAIRDRHPTATLALAIPSASTAERWRILDRLRPLGMPTMTVPGLRELMVGEARFGQLREARIEDLLGRDLVQPHEDLLGRCITGRNVLVTGAGGSIGSELCRQILRLRPRTLVMLEQSEFHLYQIEQELAEIVRGEPTLAGIPIRPALGSVLSEVQVDALLETYGIETIYHAAAYKHVTMVESNEVAGVLVNTFGTRTMARAALRCGTDTFVLISTDKAVRPTNVMGASKRLAEALLTELAAGGWRREIDGAGDACPTRFAIVRFGNVLGSSGSVVPKFQRQIAGGGPVTVTHPEVTRFFMTIAEAVNLVIQAGSLARGGDILILDMGQPVRIVDLARNLITLQGKNVRDGSRPDGDIAIEFTGLMPGEKMHEELVHTGGLEPTEHPKIGRAVEPSRDAAALREGLEPLERACERNDPREVRELLRRLA